VCSSDLTDLSLDAKSTIEFITIKAAQCLGLADKLGSLDCGKLADIAVFSIPNSEKNIENLKDKELCEFLVEGKSTLRELFVDGASIYQSN